VMHTGPVEIVAEMDARCGPDQLFAWVEDLSRYPEWLEIVTRAEPAPSAGPGAEPAWAVDLRGRIGPLARSKRLRMVRTVHEAPSTVRFERREVDGRSHSPWVLSAEVTGAGGGAHLAMTLSYGGGLFGPVLERVLRDEIARSRERLAALVEGRAASP
jgi:hypothetical protein